MAGSNRSSFSPSISRWLAGELDIPANLAVPAGERGANAMMALKRALDAGSGEVRADYVVQAQREMAHLDPARHGALLQHLQGCVLALGGRGGDTQLAHVTPGEAVVPDPLMTPEVVDLLRRTAREKGLDPDRFVVGGRHNSINPNTGLMEFTDGFAAPDDTNNAGDPQTRVCTVNAHGVYNTLPTDRPNQLGAYGVPETPGTAAIDRNQFLPPEASNWSDAQRNAYIANYRNQISGYVPDGNGGYTQVFNGVSDNIGGPAARTKLENRYQNRVLFELPGGRYYGDVDGMQFHLPWAMKCPRP